MGREEDTTDRPRTVRNRHRIKHVEAGMSGVFPNTSTLPNHLQLRYQVARQQQRRRLMSVTAVYTAAALQQARRRHMSDTTYGTEKRKTMRHSDSLQRAPALRELLRTGR